MRSGNGFLETRLVRMGVPQTRNLNELNFKSYRSTPSVRYKWYRTPEENSQSVWTPLLNRSRASPGGQVMRRRPLHDAQAPQGHVKGRAARAHARERFALRGQRPPARRGPLLGGPGLPRLGRGVRGQGGRRHHRGAAGLRRFGHGPALRGNQISRHTAHDPFLHRST